MGEIAVLVFLGVLLSLMALISRSRRDRLKEEMERHCKTPLSGLMKDRHVLSKLWKVSDYTPVHYDRAFSLGLFSGLAVLLLVPVLSRNVSPPADVTAILAGAICFLGAPYVVNDVLQGSRIKNFRANIEFGLETLVSVLIATGGNLPAAIEEVARVSPGVVGKEFGLVHDEIGSHKPVKDAFTAMAWRVPCQEAGDIADAAELYGTVGGASALALFKNLSEVIREVNYGRSKVQKEFRTMKFYAWLMGVLPVGLTAFLFFQHSWAALLLQTKEGHGAVALAAMIYLVAFGVMYGVFQFMEV